MEHAPHGSAMTIVAAVVLFSVYRRFRSHVGRQLVKPRTMGFRMVMLSLGAIAMLVAPHLAPYARIEEVAGLAVGAGLAWWGLRMTRFSADGSRRYYTPNTWLGLAISTLFIARIAYRFIVLAPVLKAEAADGGAALSPALFAGAQTGLTLALFGVVVGYYLAYYSGVLHHSRRVPLVNPVPQADVSSAESA